MFRFIHAADLHWDSPLEGLEVSGHPVVIHGRGFPNRAVPENLARGCWLVTVNDSREVESVDWRSPDVVRWQVLEASAGN